MYKFSQKSLDNLVGVHPYLVSCVYKLMSLQVMDFSVNEGVRTLARQKELFDAKKSKTMDSKHLIQADGYGHAVDLYPSPINMAEVNKSNSKEIIRFGVLAGLLISISKENNVQLRWGGDWDSDGQTLDHTFFDAPHFEIRSN